MCFFKPKMPKIDMPNVTGALPAIRETIAPEPQAALLGGGVDDMADEGEQAKKGKAGLKIPTLERAASLTSTTGASMGGFNVRR